MEELGWTGFVVPELGQRFTVLKTGLIIGVLWGVWHFLIAFWTGGSFSGGWWATYVPGILFFYPGVLPAYRVLMIWVYSRTQCMPVVMLMHASLSASSLILQPALTRIPFLIFNFVLAVVMWIVVAAVAFANGGKLSQGESRNAISFSRT